MVEAQTPETTIVIPAYNNLQYTVQCIASVERNTKPDTYEVVLINDGSTDSSGAVFETLKKEKPFVTEVVHHVSRQGFVRSVNDGVKVSKGKYIMLLNNDVITTPLWLTQLLRCMKQFGRRQNADNVAIVGPVSNYASGYQVARGASYSLESLDRFAEEYHIQNVGRWTSVHFLSGFCMLLTREIYDKVGGFDERFNPGGFEDNSFVLDALELGYKAVVCGDTFVHHFGSKTLDMPALSYMRRGLKNRKKYMEKYIERRKNKNKLVALYRVKNEEEWIGESLKACSRFCDEILLLDDGSTDKTLSIAKKFPKVKCRSYKRPFDEYRDRTELLKWGKQEKADWFIMVDGDEVPEERFTRKYVERLMNPKDPSIAAYSFKIATFWRGETNIRGDGIFGRLAGIRMFKNRPNQKIAQTYKGGLHIVAPVDLSYAYTYCPLRFKHYGYCTPELCREKYNYYVKIDKDKDPRLVGGAGDYSHFIDESSLELYPWVEDNSLGLVMIVRDEGESLEEFLNINSQYFDEMFVGVDSRTKDNTKEVLKRFGARIFDFDMNDDFSRARNFVLSKCTTKWCMQLDPDEKVGNWPAIFKMMEMGADAYSFRVRNIQKNNMFTLSQSFRLFRRDPDIYYTGRCHETIEESVTSGKRKFKLKEALTMIDHLGYLKSDEEVEKKLQRYERLNKLQMQDNPKDARPYFNLALHYVNEGMPKKGIEYLEKACKLNPKFVLAKKELGLLLMRQGKGWLIEAQKLSPPGSAIREIIDNVLDGVKDYIQDAVIVGRRRLGRP